MGHHPRLYMYINDRVPPLCPPAGYSPQGKGPLYPAGQKPSGKLTGQKPSKQLTGQRPSERAFTPQGRKAPKLTGPKPAT